MRLLLDGAEEIYSYHFVINSLIKRKRRKETKIINICNKNLFSGGYLPSVSSSPVTGFYGGYSSLPSTSMVGGYGGYSGFSTFGASSIAPSYPVAYGSSMGSFACPSFGRAANYCPTARNCYMPAATSR